jgi:small GTP-binding protein
MGVIFTKYFNWFWFKPKQFRIIMIGLDNAGKTQILYKLKLGDTIVTVPTIGFNVETVTHGSVDLVVWDIGGQDRLRVLWKHYTDGINGLIYVIDSSDRERITEAIECLSKELTAPHMYKVPILIFANKQDLPNAIKGNELNDKLDILFRNHEKNYKIFESVATEDIGLIEGIDWLSHEVVKTFW